MARKRHKIHSVALHLDVPTVSRKLTQPGAEFRANPDFSVADHGGIRMNKKVTTLTDQRVRCSWARNDLAIRYHDREWGVPVHDDRLLFEFLILEGAQAGLSWDTILRKRENYRAAFDNFDPEIVARYNAKKVRSLMNNEGIVRNRLKIASAVSNAQAMLAVTEEFGSFNQYIWELVGGSPQTNAWTKSGQVPASTAASDAMSKDLKKRGFRFVGSTICYAFMQAVGMVNDPLVTCFRYSPKR
jgi:DNA-3-methyladenine glycosylase I